MTSNGYVLREDQETALAAISFKMSKGKRRVLLQLPTGVGKTVCFTTMVSRYHTKSKKRSLISVHRDELLQQSKKTLKAWYDINAQAVVSETKHIYDYSVYTAMCETIYRRLQKNPKYLPDIGLAIIDECHLGNFSKIYQYFPNSLIAGVTATPISSNLKDPLYNHYDDIVCGESIQYYIQSGILSQNHTYSPKNINRGKLQLGRNGEFDDASTGEVFSRLRHVQNAITKYEKYAGGKKCIVYNCNKYHNRVMQRAFSERGYVCQIVDDETPMPERKAIFRWFKENKGAILCNVGVATMGFDEATVECILVNRATTSLVLWIQMCGRGSRIIDLDFIRRFQKEYNYPLELKSEFIIIDMGANGREGGHGDWNAIRDWEDMFWHPPKARTKLGAAAYKECPKCESLIPAQCHTCEFCGYEFPVVVQTYDTQDVDMELITKNIDVKALLLKNVGKKEMFTLYQIGANISTRLKYKLGKLHMSDEMAEKALHIYQDRAREWCAATGRIWSEKYERFTMEFLYDQFKRDCNWTPAKLLNMKEIAMHTTKLKI